jgi:hypothetical protein
MCMRYLLTKQSKPGWEQRFLTRGAARQRLWPYICQQCRVESGITEQSSIYKLLDTACGEEFWFEDLTQPMVWKSYHSHKE